MQNISTRLAKSHLIELEKIVNELYDSSEKHIKVSFWKGVSLTLPQHKGDISLTAIISRLKTLYLQQRVTPQAMGLYLPPKIVHKILLLCSEIENKTSNKVKTATKITRMFLQMKRFFIRIFWCNRTKIAKRLQSITLKMMLQTSKFHISTLQDITNEKYTKKIEVDFIEAEKLPKQLKMETVIMNSFRSATNRSNLRIHGTVKDEIALTTPSSVDVLATHPDNFQVLNEYLDKQKLLHRFSIISLEDLSKNLEDSSLNLFSLNCHTPLPY